MTTNASFPYRTYASYLRERFHQPTRKISLHAGFSCPNRDGRLSDKGCIFCEPATFSPHVKTEPEPLIQQLRTGVEQGHKRGIHCFVAYFQAYTNTYGSVKKLQDIYDTIRAFPEIKGLAIGTRPDCIDADKLNLINSYTQEYDVWLELGLQSIHDQTLVTINRGHDSKTFFDAVDHTRQFPKIKIAAHVILGLPDETIDMESETAKALAKVAIDGIKLHPLYAVRETALGRAYSQGKIELLSKEQYLERVINFLGYIPPETVVQRVTADCPQEQLLAPPWLNHKNRFIQELVDKMRTQHQKQGWHYSSR